MLNQHTSKKQNKTFKSHKVKTIELTGEINKATIIVGDFKTPFWVIDRTSRQKSNKDIEEFNTINLLYPVDSYRTLYPTTT